METMSEIASKIFQIEEKFDLFEKKINGVYFWKIIRVQVFNEVVKKKNIYKEAHKIKKSNSIMFKNILESIMGKKREKKENGFFISDRLDINKNEIYSTPILEKYKETSEIIYPFLISKERKNKNINYINIENVDYIINYFLKKISKLKKTINKKDINFINQVSLEIEKELNITRLNMLMINEIDNQIKNFKISKKFYKKFIKKRGYKKIYLVCSYGRENLIAAAKELKVEVIEIQHGIITECDLGYHFPKSKYIPYFPDKFLGFSRYWYKNVSFPLKEENFIIKGYPYLNKQLAKINKYCKDENKIIFISQWTVGEIISKKAVEFAKENPKKEVIIRLHPGEFKIWEKKYKILFENRKLENLQISDNNEKKLHDYLSESLYVIGGYSTVLFEALEIGCKVQLLDVPGVDRVGNLIDEGIYVTKMDEKIDLKKFKALKKSFFNIDKGGYNEDYKEK